jgi:hypothetical protein
MRRSTQLFLALGLLAMPAAAGEIIWDNYPSGHGQTLVSSQLDPAYPFDSQTADDFMFAETGDEPWAITDVHWVGGFWQGMEPAPGEPFNIYFYADDGTGNAPTGGPDDPSDTALETYYGLLPDETDLGDWRYAYELDLPTPFIADNNVKYWIAIQSVLVFPPMWGMADSLDTWGATAKIGFPLIGDPYWSELPEPMDIAFRLTGYRVPEPASLLAFAFGALMLARRARQA